MSPRIEALTASSVWTGMLSGAASLSASAAPMASRAATRLCLRNPVDFDLDVMVHLRGGVAAAVESHVARAGALCVHDAALVGLDVGRILTRPESEHVLVVAVVE